VKQSPPEERKKVKARKKEIGFRILFKEERKDDLEVGKGNRAKSCSM